MVLQLQSTNIYEAVANGPLSHTAH